MRLLSKTKIIAFRQCPKRLWLEIHRPELRVDSAETLARFQVGYQVGDVAKRIYDPNQKGTAINLIAEGFGAAIARSAELLANSLHPIFEAGFTTDGALAFADVMLPEQTSGRRAWKMVEVKSATSVRDYHRDDVAVQAFIARAAGVDLKFVALACIDTAWIYPGGDDYRGLLTESDLTEEVLARDSEVAGWFKEAHVVAAQATEPKIEMGAHCHAPFDCSFCEYCQRGKPQPEHPIDCLPQLSAAKRRKLAEHGLTELRDAPDAWLNEKQRLVKKCTLTNTVFFDATGSAADLAGCGFPAYFLDFESIQFAVPIWAGTRPYQQHVYQFSLHKITGDGQLSHREFLDLTGGNPSQPLAAALIEACEAKGPIFVYNAAFEKARINELAERFPKLAHALLAINARVVDLLPVARNRYYHPSQQGSWSIKSVLPAAVPELNYEALVGVKDGGTAMDAYAEATKPGTTPQRKAEIERQLLAYCRLDTFAMVRLWQFFSGRNQPPLTDDA